MSVGRRINGHRSRQAAISKGHRAGGRSKRRRAGLRVVGVEGGRPADREVDGELAAGIATGEGVDEVGRTVLVRRQRRHRHRHGVIVVVDGACGRVGNADLVAGASSNGQDHRLIRLSRRIRRRVNRHNRRRVAGGEVHRAGGRGERRCTGLRVVGVEGGRPVDREVHRQRAGGIAGAGEGVDEVGRPVLIHRWTEPPLL